MKETDQYDDECDLWDSSSKVALRRGLKMTPHCPYAKTCSGETCEWEAKKPIEPVVLPEHIETKLQELLNKPRR